jgi:hypothetical protein
VSDASQNAVAEALWSKVLEDFSSDKTHEAFLEHCRNANLLPEAARRYREHKNTLNEAQKEEREAVDKRLSAVAILAMSQLDAKRSPPATRGKKVLTLIAAVIALGSVLGLAMLYAM